ncbi:hypothetical protein FM020_06275 [Acinetobacter tandoii]|nr:hypothetical protein FM020_06275 [Acinetobacter tandoii]
MYKMVILFTSTLAVSQLNAATYSATLGITSDYRFAGISQTSGNPAVQGHFDIAFDNGIYSSVWASNVDWGDDADLELDYYVGYIGKLSDNLSYDLNLGYFTYPGYQAADIDYGQAYVKLMYKGASALYGYTDTYANTGKSAEYVSLDYSHPLYKAICFNLHAGRSFGDYWQNSYYGEYNDYSIGIAGSYRGIDMSLSWLTNDIKPHTNSGPYRDDSTFVVSASHTF